MPLEATMLVIDNSEWMRNGDYPPSRWDAQTDAVNILFDAKTNSHPENMVGILTMAGQSPEVLASLTQDIGKIFAAIHASKLAGSLNLVSGINVAQLALKHRQNKNQRQRVIAFVGSPVSDSEESLVQLAKKLKKNNVAVDIVNFGEDAQNESKLAKFLETVNSSDNSHLLTVPAGTQLLSDTLLSSPIVVEGGTEGGAGPSASHAEYGGIDPNMDPELAMALRMSLEEEQARQRASTQSGEGASGSLVPPDATPISGSDAMQTEPSGTTESNAGQTTQGTATTQQSQENASEAASTTNTSDASRATVAGMHEGDDDEEMTEEDAIARAIEMSLMDSKTEQKDSH
ncbi:proteasome regulatory particle base subunit rpn10 [Malassezia yamatoensis]|uniref:Proteasome regulatory particle base subunit rpn10 n=1 Tax=Malassezia yamatoensis TaxID=253288 RepID=A0AAJ5YQE3_9BASI|nr:proteasome regulatory particle base subunit rpn10 [Malassezia yamatoensis]